MYTKTKTTSVEIFTESEATFNKALLSILTADEPKYLSHAKEYGEIIDLFNCDPDYVRVNGVKIPFVEVDVKSVKCVIVPDYAIDKGYSEETDAIDSNKLKTILTAFFADNFKDSFSRDINNNTWPYFNQIDNGIAFRGGSGYAYTIWTLNQ